MRLRLKVRRPGVPDTNMLWNVSLGGKILVSRLMSQVDTVLSLQTGNACVEDYVVEYTDEAGVGFECLHFQTVNQILKEDDRIL